MRRNHIDLISRICFNSKLTSWSSLLKTSVAFYCFASLVFAKIAIANSGIEVNPDHVIDSNMSLEKQMEIEDTLADAELGKEEVARLKKSLEEERRRTQKIKADLARETRAAKNEARTLERQVRQLRQAEESQKKQNAKIEAERQLNRTRLNEIREEYQVAKLAERNAASELKLTREKAEKTHQALAATKANLNEISKIIEITKSENETMKQSLGESTEALVLLGAQMKDASASAQTQIVRAKKALVTFQVEMENLNNARSQTEMNHSVVKNEVDSLNQETKTQTQEMARASEEAKAKIEAARAALYDYQMASKNLRRAHEMVEARKHQEKIQAEQLQQRVKSRALASRLPAKKHRSRGSLRKNVRRMALTTDCNIRTKPTVKSRVVATGKNGSRLLVSPFNSKWVRSHVKSGKTLGFVAKSCL